ncbi:MAM33 family protein [Aspergillus ruber CBS 135680]|uniref:Regulatory protein SUAPRGA1 n=1 Tax=Aspergillus ruber (strain CBS 135680) TaxID=1388766 RepID=A0A017S730_ASPRC|nr:regulatory protein SUAPRGA1 [Aspergillus ruber CBS 135680]EYE91960.1 regulatory protein SUAPRGA1 [Aspergillus ruber CBS 135680]
MLFLRTLARSVPRTISRSIASSAPSVALRPGSTIPKSLFQSQLKQVARPSYAAFSTCRAFRQAAEGDVELAAKLEDELSHEKASGLNDLETSVQNIQYVLQNNSFEVKDVPGEQEIVLTKKFNNEEIRLTFTVADLQNLTEQEEFDDALGDELDYEGGHQAANQGRPGNVAQHAEDRVAPADREMDPLERDVEPSFPARVNVTIEKPGNGALLIQTVAQDGLFQIEEVSYFQKPDLAHAQTAEKDWARQSLYAGPPFENLDEDLQTFLERYLEERGVNAELANMIPDYIQVKEQKEYVRWLENVRNFVSA